MQQTTNLTLYEGKIVQWEDPDVGNHADGCPMERECYYVGPIKKITVRDGETYVHLKGGVKTHADDDNLSEVNEWLETAFDNSEYEQYMWYTEHWDNEWCEHNEYPCDWPCDFDNSDIEHRTKGA